MLESGAWKEPRKQELKSINSKTIPVFQLIYKKKQRMMNYTILFDPIRKPSENLKHILVHIVKKVFCNTSMSNK